VEDVCCAGEVGGGTWFFVEGVGRRWGTGTFVGAVEHGGGVPLRIVRNIRSKEGGTYSEIVCVEIFWFI